MPAILTMCHVVTKPTIKNRCHGGAFRIRALSQITACAYQAKNVPPKHYCAPQKSNRPGATGGNFEVVTIQITARVLPSNIVLQKNETGPLQRAGILGLRPRSSLLVPPKSD